MSHSDDNGFVAPPALAPLHIVIVPIYKTDEDLEEIKSFLKPLTDYMNSLYLDFAGKYTKESVKLKYKLDDDSFKSPGWKFNEWELK